MRTKGEGGFTLLETLAAMGILSVLLSLIALSLSSSVTALRASADRLLFAARLLRADALIRSKVNEIAIPYWETPSLEEDRSSLAIPWYGGRREASLRIETGGGRLIMETREGEKTETLTLLTGLEGAELSLLRDDLEIPWGIGVTYVYKQHSYHTWAAFSSISLGRENP
jgi:prepilin-type N-terminal cleavage/methylation domain-containing protein